MALYCFPIFAFIVGAANFQVMTGPICTDGKYYNSTLGRCCGNCNEGEVARSACIQDRKKDCIKRCDPGYYINWDQSTPKCATCNKCSKDDLLVEIQKCSLHTEPICRCQDGYYCRTVLRNTCARCEPHRGCPLGQGVKTKGTPHKDTECEACPSGTYSNIKSATEKCKPHTDCAKFQQVTLREGNPMTDTVCVTSSATPLNSENKNVPLESEKFGANGGTFSSAGQRYTTPRAHTVHHIFTTSIVTSTATSTKEVDGIKGKWNKAYIAAMIILILILLIALVMTLKQKLCLLKLWIKKKTYFIQPKHKPNRTVLNHEEEDKKQNLLQRQNSAPSQLVTLESHQKMEGGQTKRASEEKIELQQGRDHLNNKIEKIYIMNADTVVVGSISEVPSKSQRLVTVESNEKESLVLEYPEQESSKMPASDLMLSIEEEESEGTTAKVILQG